MTNKETDKEKNRKKAISKTNKQTERRTDTKENKSLIKKNNFFPFYQIVWFIVQLEA